MNSEEKVSLKTLILKRIDSSSFHGLPNIFRASFTLLKIIWVVLFVLSIVISLILVYKSTFDYFNFDVVSGINVVYENPALFPTISICNLQMKLSFNFSLDDILLDCSFDGKRCNSSDFKTYYDSYYGKCYRFNDDINSIKKIYRPGKANSFQMKLFSGILNENDTLAGFHIFVHNASIKPNYNEGIDIPVGLRTNLLIERIFVEKLEYPYDYCLNDPMSNTEINSKILLEMKQLNLTYRQKDCYDMCLYLEVRENCNCNYSLDKIYEHCFENYINQIQNNVTKCAAKIESSYYKDHFYEKCKDVCPLECNWIDYHLSMSLAGFQTDQYALELLKRPSILSLYPNVTLNALKKNIVFFRVYYDELKYTIITQMPKMTFQDAVSNFGGILGLFLGISFLSFAEFLDIIFETLYYIYKRNNTYIENPNDSLSFKTVKEGSKFSK